MRKELKKCALSVHCEIISFQSWAGFRGRNSTQKNARACKWMQGHARADHAFHFFTLNSQSQPSTRQTIWINPVNGYIPFNYKTHPCPASRVNLGIRIVGTPPLLLIIKVYFLEYIKIAETKQKNFHGAPGRSFFDYQNFI